MFFRATHERKWEWPHLLMAAFFVLALFLNGCSDSSSKVGVAPVDTEAPSAPANLTAEAVSATQINLSWDASTDNVAVTGYKVYRDNTLVTMLPATNTTYADTGLSGSGNYSYEISAVDAAKNESARSPAVVATLVDAEAPSVPENLAAEAVSASQINLAWDASTDNVAVTGYRVYRDDSLVDSTTETTFADTGLSEGNTYSYEVSAMDAAGNESGRSLAVQATTISTGVTEAVNIFLDSILPDQNYTMFHGSTSPDRTKMLVSVNKSEGPQTGSIGTIDLYLLDAAELEKGNVEELATGQVVGGGAGTISFRSSWTPDGSKIALAAGDRIFVLNADTLEPQNGENGDADIAGQAHDALTTADGKYAIMAIRTNLAGPKDGELQLYDLEAGAAVGNATDVCRQCHAPDKDLTLCGLDGVITESGGTYSGTVYVAGHGGHFAKAALTIDPTAAKPINATLSKLEVSMVKFAEGDSQYKLHDARLDGDILYWSTYNTDANGQVHYGKVDLANGNAVTDIAIDVDERATKPGTGINKMPMYCASGQTDDYFMPITMTNEAYITVIPKNTIDESTPAPAPIVKTATNVFIDNIHSSLDYNMFHGSSSPDGTKTLVTVNEGTGPGEGMTGKVFLYMLDSSKLEQGEADLVSEATVTGDHSGDFGNSIGFRSNWTPDGSKIAFAGGDRFWVLDAETLEPLNGDNGDINIAGQNHDALPTTDGKYAILTVRTNLAGPKDGKIQLYDMVKGEAVGNAVSVCNSCHGSEKDATLCGLDGVVAYDGVPGYGGSYKGTIYVAGHGGHFAEIDIEIDPTNTNDPIKALTPYSNLKMLNVSMKKFAAGEPGENTSQYKLHDARLDGTTLYWSTYNTDENGQVHYGKIDLANGNAVSDYAIDVDDRATVPDRSVEDRNKMPMYCASGQSERVFMPITMTNEAYITVIPKLGIQ